MLTEGRVREAVAVLRKSHNLRRNEARAWIDAHIADDPMLSVQLEAQQRARRRRVFFWVLFIDIVVAAAIIYYLF